MLLWNIGRLKLEYSEEEKVPKQSTDRVKVFIELKDTSNDLSMCQTNIGPCGQKLNFVYNAH